MHPVVQRGVLGVRRGDEQEDREQDPSDRIAWPAGRDHGAHHRPSPDQADTDDLAGHVHLMGEVVERHIGQGEHERERAEHDGRGRRRPP
jgi:hypothetical protein